MAKSTINTDTKKTNGLNAKNDTNSALQQVAEKTVKTKQTRNRPDLQNFGQEYIQNGDNTRFIDFQMRVFELPKVDMRNPEEVQNRIKDYFEICREADMKPAVTGLALALKMSRVNLWRYREGNVGTPEVSNLIKNAYYLLENYWEIMMQNGKINPVSGIFLAKNHFNYQDKQDVVITPNEPFKDRRSAEDLAEEYMLPETGVNGDNAAEEFPPPNEK